jgi:hypothetical protein
MAEWQYRFHYDRCPSYSTNLKCPAPSRWYDYDPEKHYSLSRGVTIEWREVETFEEGWYLWPCSEYDVTEDTTTAEKWTQQEYQDWKDGHPDEDFFAIHHKCEVTWS